MLCSERVVGVARTGAVHSRASHMQALHEGPFGLAGVGLKLLLQGLQLFIFSQGPTAGHHKQVALQPFHSSTS